jgi:hypothetical protein
MKIERGKMDNSCNPNGNISSFIHQNFLELSSPRGDFEGKED